MSNITTENVLPSSIVFPTSSSAVVLTKVGLSTAPIYTSTVENKTEINIDGEVFASPITIYFSDPADFSSYMATWTITPTSSTTRLSTPGLKPVASKSHGLNVKYIALVVILIAAFIIGLGILICVWRRRHTKSVSKRRKDVDSLPEDDCPQTKRYKRGLNQDPVIKSDKEPNNDDSDKPELPGSLHTTKTSRSFRKKELWTDANRHELEGSSEWPSLEMTA